MLRARWFKTLTVASTLVLSATGCTSGDVGGGAANGASSSTSASTPAAENLPGSLASSKGWLAYSTFIGRVDRIHLTRIDGSEDHQIVPELPGEVIRADFSRDGRLAFEQLPPDGAANVYVANADGTDPRMIAECKIDECEHEFPAWSPDGKYLATHTALGRGPIEGPAEFAIGIIEVATQQVRLILRHPAEQFQEQLIRWSPDGRKLVFYRWRPAEGQRDESPDAEAAVFTVNIDGTGLKQLTPWTMRCGDPDWSSDGSTILCTTHPPGDFDFGRGNIYTLKPDGSDLRALTKNGDTGPRAGHARFTPDGKTILYARAATSDWFNSPRHLHAINLSTAQDVPVLTQRDIYTRPALQPDPQDRPR
jgi:TolB protein